MNFWASKRLRCDTDEQVSIRQTFVQDLLKLLDVAPGNVRILSQHTKSPLSRARFASSSYYQSQAKALDPGAILIESLPLHKMSRISARLILNNIAAAFPELRVFRVNQELILIASAETIKLKPLKDEKFSPESILGKEEWIPRAGFKDAYGRTYGHTVNKLALFYWGLRDAYNRSLTSVDQILGTPDEWRWSLIYSRHSLLAEYIQQNGGNINLAKIIQAGCGHGKIDLVEPNWRYLRTPCRDALVGAIAADPSATPQHLQREFGWLTDFKNPDTASALPNAHQSLQEVLDQIYWFAQMDSIFLRLSPKRLIWQTSKCYSTPSPKHLFCRSELVRTLSYCGYFDLANKELLALERDGGLRLDRKTTADLKSYLAAAKAVR
ncbi:MAG: hypothetical protein GX589_08565 [Deltaproteobacteria bacterium]|nr:hypothetical protein [Deltaproteobacteria bacterium]